MNRIIRTSIVLSLIPIVLVGCGRQQTAQPPSTSTTSSASVDGSKYLLTAEPDGPEDVIQVRESAKDEEEVVILGKIGGSKNPWLEGQAAFHIVDRSLKSCSDREGDNCQSPWDYCCETKEQRVASMAFIKVVDEDGATVKADARELLNVKELQTVVVRGKAKRDDADNLTVLASGVYVRHENHE